MENPFTPGFGQYPTVSARRPQIVRTWEDAFHPDTRSHPAQSTLLIGDRGVGKTVLLDTLHDVAVYAGWIVVNVAGGAATVAPVEARLIDELWADRVSPPRTTTQLGVRLGPLTIEREWGPLPTERPTSLRDAVEITLSRAPHPTGVLLVLDELHDIASTHIKSIGNQLQLLRRDGYRVGFAGAGLPTMNLADPRRIPTFLTRSWSPTIDYLDTSTIVTTFQQTLESVDASSSPEAAAAVAAHAGGLPYAMQLLGWEAFAAAAGDRITVDHVTAVLPGAHRELIRSLMLDYDLSPSKRRFVAAMSARDQPVRMADIGEILDRTPQQLSPIRSRLLNEGLIISPDRGLVGFAHHGHRAIAATDPSTQATLQRARQL